MKKIHWLIVSIIALSCCKMDVGVLVSAEESNFYCHECEYRWLGSTLTTTTCPRCESYRIEIMEE